MSPTPRRRRAAPPADPFPESGLAELGLARGDQVRFRRTDAERWKQATVARRERDGSVGLHDPKGASRSIPVACIEVRSTGPRGGVVWEALADRAARTEQLPLVATPTRSRRRRGGPPLADEVPDADADADTHSDTDAPTDPDPAARADASDDEGPDGQLALL
jgi:hypothetical protein